MSGIIVLPPGMSVECARYHAVLTCDDERALQAYAQLTASQVRSVGSPYFWNNWPPEFGLMLTHLVQQLRVAAMHPRGVALSHKRLAERVLCHPDTVRLFVRWWHREIEKPPFEVPGEPEYVREVVRTYIRRIAPDPYHHGTGSPRYRYWTFGGEVIHRRHLQAFSVVDAGLRQGQRVFSFPGLDGLGLFGEDRIAIEVAQGPAEPDLNPMAHLALNPMSPSDPMAHLALNPMADSDLEAGNDAQGPAEPDLNPMAHLALGHPLSPTPPIPHANDSNRRIESNERIDSTVSRATVGEQPGESAADTARRLIASGLTHRQARMLLGLPDGPSWANRQLAWLPMRLKFGAPSGDPIHNAAAWLIAAIRGACDGNPYYTTPPEVLHGPGSTAHRPAPAPPGDGLRREPSGVRRPAKQAADPDGLAAAKRRLARFNSGSR